RRRDRYDRRRRSRRRNACVLGLSSTAPAGIRRHGRSVQYALVLQSRRPRTGRAIGVPSARRRADDEGTGMGLGNSDHLPRASARGVCEDFVDTVGNTPLIKLRKASELTGCTILGKAEFLTPGGSVKDRAAKYIVLDAEKRKVVERGGLIVEGTAGNTGIG